MSPNTTPNAPTSSAVCAGDRVGATVVSVAIPIPPPLPTSTVEGQLSATVTYVSTRGATFGRVWGHWGRFSANLDVFLTPGRTFDLPKAGVRRSDWCRVRRGETGVRGSAAAQRPNGGHAAAQTGGAGGVLFRPDLLGGLCDGADPAGAGRGRAGGAGHHAMGGAGGDPVAGHCCRLLPADLLRLPERRRRVCGEPREPRRVRLAGRRGRATGGLRDDGRGVRDLRGCRGDVGDPDVVPARGHHRGRPDPGAHCREPARYPGVGAGVRRPDVRLRRADRADVRLGRGPGEHRRPAGGRDRG